MFQPQPIHLIAVGGQTPPFDEKTNFHNWFNGFFELQMVVAAQPYFIPYRPDQPYGEQWAKVGRYLRREWASVQGVVVLLPPEQLDVAARYLSLMLGPVGKPVVCIASLGSTADEAVFRYQQLNLHTNTVNASQVAVGPCSGVMIVNGTEILLQHGVEQSTIVGRVDFGVKLNEHAILRNETWPHGPFSASDHVRWMDAAQQYGEKISERSLKDIHKQLDQRL